MCIYIKFYLYKSVVNNMGNLCKKKVDKVELSNFFLQLKKFNSKLIVCFLI